MAKPVSAIWGLHMGAHHGTQPIDKGYVAIGWPEAGDLSTLPKTREAFKARLAEKSPQMSAGAIPVAAGVLYRFAVEMQEDDIVVYPSKADRMVNIGRVSGPFQHVPNVSAEYPNRRPVTWLKSVPRASFSQSALHEIGSAITMFRISTHAEEFFAALIGEPIDPEPLDDSVAEQVSVQVEESTEDFIIKRLKGAQTTYQFEHFVAHLLKCMGYYARVTQASGDGGVDIIAHRDELGFEPPIIKVQCKQVIATIGRPEVQQLHGAIEPGEHGLFVTLGSFSADARAFERTKPNLRLLDGSALIDLIFNHYHQFEPRYQMLLPLRRVYVPGPLGQSED
jgi:restriction system protein